MKTEDLKELIKDGLGAQQAGSKVAAKATDDILDDAKSPELRAALEKGNAMAKVWASRIEQSIQEIGGSNDQDNEILEAHYEVSKKIRKHADSNEVRDLGIIASGQLATHYWIGAFGTLASYAEAVGYTQTAQNMKTSADEAKKSDEEYTAIAKRLLTGLEA